MQQTVTPPNLLILFDFLIYAMGFDGGDEGITGDRQITDCNH